MNITGMETLPFRYKLFVTSALGVFLGVTIWLWAEFGASVYITRVIVAAYACL